ncbi:MAG: hypothetical protein VB934_06370, partial [Polyangiaceae bacterium]
SPPREVPMTAIILAFVLSTGRLQGSSPTTVVQTDLYECRLWLGTGTRGRRGFRLGRRSCLCGG